MQYRSTSASHLSILARFLHLDNSRYGRIFLSVCVYTIRDICLHEGSHETTRFQYSAVMTSEKVREPAEHFQGYLIFWAPVKVTVTSSCARPRTRRQIYLREHDAARTSSFLRAFMTRPRPRSCRVMEERLSFSLLCRRAQAPSPTCPP